MSQRRIWAQILVASRTHVTSNIMLVTCITMSGKNHRMSRLLKKRKGTLQCRICKHGDTLSRVIPPEDGALQCFADDPLGTLRTRT